MDTNKKPLKNSSARESNIRLVVGVFVLPAAPYRLALLATNEAHSTHAIKMSMLNSFADCHPFDEY